MNTVSAMSSPRFGPLLNSQSMIEAFGPMQIPMIRHDGIWWHHGLSELMEQAVAEGREFVITLDYDTVFNEWMARMLLALISAAPQADAVCGAQSHRGESGILGEPLEPIRGPLTRLKQAHFGLTVFRTKSLDEVPRPWFTETPNKEGRWADGKVDADIGFWQKWFGHGKTIYQANNVPIGHLVEAIMWPSKNGKPILQNPAHWHQTKKPPPGVFGT